jgi:tetratricopeptide (TPR) repeat protein
MLDALFVALVCALAFLLASTPARNSDLWLHLASGRWLVREMSPRGPEPFASTTAGVSWVNHSWLSDVALYELFALGGDRALVVAKAVLVTGLAALFFLFRRRGTRVGLLGLAAALAVLALGPWLLLQPALLSLLGVVLTLYLLERLTLVEEDWAKRVRALWLLLPLFALWANLDGWFLLGPALVGLYALGELIRPRLGGNFRALALFALAGLGACLLTPYHYRIFAWPTPLGLSHAEQALMRDPLGWGLVLSPFGGHFPNEPAFASPGGWAYCLLLAAGAASFALCGRALHPGRLLAWLALAALSLYQARAIPFFAVAAGPILALNLQQWATTAATSDVRRRLQIALRGGGALAGLALLVLAWPGWLQPTPYRVRGWAVEPDGSLVRMARQLERWHEAGKFRSDHVALTFSPEVAHYLAWFCPSEKGFLDSRWPLFDGVADDFVRMRRDVLQSDGPGPDPELGRRLDAYHIDRIIVHDPDWGRTTRAYSCLLTGEPEWQLLAVEGGAVLFGRRPTDGRPSPWDGLAFDCNRAAYDPPPDQWAPRDGPREPLPPGPFDSFVRKRDDRSPDRSEATLHLIYFDLMGERQRAELGGQWLLAQIGGLVASGPGCEPAGTAGAVAVRLCLTPLDPAASPAAAQEGAPLAAPLFTGFLAAHDRGPPAALLLAVRAARRALAANPDDAGALLLLGEAYLRLGRQTREQVWQADVPDLAALRLVQALTALEQAVLLRPDLEQAHTLLARLYYEGGQMDRALDHQRARLRLAEHETAAGGPGAEAAAERQAALKSDVEKMEALVRRSENVYQVNTAGRDDASTVADRAGMAARYGLTRKALEMLLGSKGVIFGKAGARLELDLMLQAGRAYEARAWLEPELETELSYGPYHRLRARAAAACGDYTEADAELDRLSEELRKVGVAKDQFMPVRAAVAFRVAGAVLTRPAPASGAAGLAAALYRQFDDLQPLGGPAELMRQEANLLALRGLLALEWGDVETARRHFREALKVWGDDDRAATGAGLDFPARPLAEQELRRLSPSRARSGAE